MHAFAVIDLSKIIRNLDRARWAVSFTNAAADTACLAVDANRFSLLLIGTLHTVNGSCRHESRTLLRISGSEKGEGKGSQLQKKSIAYVSAKAQCMFYETLHEQGFFTDEEEEYFRRGRNGNAGTVPHNTDVKVYRISTGFEALLGALWAEKAWGRFWGWDPKETWALIALLIYLAVLHARYVGWIKGFGLNAASILAFQGIIMAGYGVNYILGTGKHSYGFGIGGEEIVAIFVGIEILLVLFAVIRYRMKRLKND